LQHRRAIPPILRNGFGASQDRLLREAEKTSGCNHTFRVSLEKFDHSFPSKTLGVAPASPLQTVLSKKCHSLSTRPNASEPSLVQFHHWLQISWTKHRPASEILPSIDVKLKYGPGIHIHRHQEQDSADMPTSGNHAKPVLGGPGSKLCFYSVPIRLRRCGVEITISEQC
jgi:hypothetical protein